MGFKSSQISKSKAKDINDYASRFFLIHCISKFNEENRKKICLNSSKNYLLICVYFQKVFLKILNTLYMQMGISFNLISINLVPVHKAIV